MNKTPQSPFFAEASAFHALVNRADWAASPLGLPGGWPAALRANVGMMLDARVPMGIIWGPQRCIVYNEAYTSLLGAKHPWALGRPASEVWAEIWRDIEPLIESAYAGEARDVQDVALQIRRTGAPEQGWFTIYCSPLRDDDGAVAGMSSTVIETTARMRAELEVRELNRSLDRRVFDRTAELERSKAHLLSLFRQTTAGIVECDLDLRFVDANDEFCRIVGRPRDALLGLDLSSLVHPDDRAANAAALAAMLRERRPFEVENRYLRPDGSTVWVTKMVSPIVDPDASAPGSIMAIVIDVTARREAEARLRASAERLQLATETAELGIWSWDPKQDRPTWENERMYDIVGVPRGGEPVNTQRFLAEFLHPDDAARYRRAMEGAFAGDGVFHFEGRYRHGATGETRWIEFNGRLQRDADGRPLHMIGTAADVSTRKRALEQLRDAQVRRDATLSAGEIGTWMFDLRAYKLYADANMARLHGLSDADVASASPLAYLNVIHPDDLAAVRASLARARDGGELYDCIYRTRAEDGAERIVHARGRVEFEDGVPALLPGVVIDITRQRAMEEALRVREQRYRTLISSIDEGFCLAEVIRDGAGRPVDHRMLELNAAFERHTGLTDALGKTASQAVPGIAQYWNELYAGVAESGTAVRTLKYNDAVKRWYDVFVAKADGPSPDQVAIVFRDVTAQKEADEALRRLAEDLARANRRQNEFLATLAHELRNPLAPIRTGLDLMRMSAGGVAATAKVRDMMERQVNHLIHLVNDLLDLARIQSGKIELKPARVVLQEIAADAVEAALPLVQSKHHRLDVDAPPRPIRLDADPNRLVQVIANLLTNAAKYTPDGGRIRLALRREGDRALVEVSDNGIGIPAESLPTLFDMFSQGRHGSSYAQGGLGIGLSLVKTLAEQHGGDVAASSAGPGQGSRFTLRLPLVADPGADSDAAADADTDLHAAGRPGPAGAACLRILIADDNRDAAELLAQSLQLAGHTVDIVHDGQAALAAAKATRPDLALLDIGMPGMDGYRVAEAIRGDAALDGTVLAAITGWGAKDDRERARRAGFDHHLTKPVDLASIDALAAAVAAGRT